jgi:hypothetical protein
MSVESESGSLVAEFFLGIWDTIKGLIKRRQVQDAAEVKAIVDQARDADKGVIWQDGVVAIRGPEPAPNPGPPIPAPPEPRPAPAPLPVPAPAPTPPVIVVPPMASPAPGPAPGPMAGG